MPSLFTYCMRQDIYPGLMQYLFSNDILLHLKIIERDLYAIIMVERNLINEEDPLLQ